MLLGGEGAAGADEYLKPPEFYAKISAKLHIRGKDAIEKPHRLSGMLFKTLF